MTRWTALLMLATLGLGLAAQAATVAEMQGHRRVLLIAAPDPQDSAAAAQRRILAGWTRQAADRDISLVDVAGTRVTGAAESAVALRRRYGLKPGLFAVLLIGKDGHVALRSARPVAAVKLQTIIDGMPMRQAGEH